MKKKLFTLILTLCLTAALALCTVASAKSNKVLCTNVADVGTFVFDGYNQGEQGSIQIIQGNYTSNRGNTFPIYVIFVSGTENEVQYKVSNSGLSVDFAMFNIKNSPYYYRIKTIIRENIPEGSRIAFVGHSLGGMMTQQLATDTTLKNEYIIKYDLCLGAPLIQPDDEREGGLQRLGDKSDIVPYETANLLTHPKESLRYSRESGDYGILFWTAHMNSYKNADVWGEYDVTGKKGGSATLELDLSTRQFYKSDWVLIIQDLLSDLSESK